jgi:predicted dehydrogenase
MKEVTAVLIGAGNRGSIYANYSLENPCEFRLVGVAEPNKERRERICASHAISEHSYDSWDELLSKPRIADCAIICTQDKLHFEPTMKALQKNYHVLLEKPMSGDMHECIKLEEEAEKHERLLLIAHVLRYSDFFKTIYSILTKGVIGRLISINLVENVGYWHFAHSFVRGYWRNSLESNPIILAKSCHDMDILAWYTDSDARSVVSFGKLNYFIPENKPKGATKKCLDGCPHIHACLYSVKNIYSMTRSHELADILSEGQGKVRLIQELKESQFGDCVFDTDNNVVDNQVTAIEFQNGVTATFMLNAFSNECTRNIRLVGTEGEISGDTLGKKITYIRFREDTIHSIELPPSDSGHGGGDSLLIKDFIGMVRNDQTDGPSSARLSLMSHIMAFAAEESRVTRKIVCVEEFVRGK